MPLRDDTIVMAATFAKMAVTVVSDKHISSNRKCSGKHVR